MMAHAKMEDLLGDNIQRVRRQVQKDSEGRKEHRNKGNGVKRRNLKKEKEVTYKRRVGQSHESCCHFSDEYDEDDGEELQGQLVKNITLIIIFLKIKSKSKLIKFPVYYN